MACLDTSTLIDFMGKGTKEAREGVERLLRQLRASGEELVTTRLNVAELWVGVNRSRDMAAEHESMQAALSGLRILELDDEAGETFGQIKAHVTAAGQPRGDMDLLIAAVALSNAESIVTRNVRHFSGIPGLTVLTY